MLRPENGGRLVLRRASRAVRSERDRLCPPPRARMAPYWGPRASYVDESVEERALSAQLHLDVGWAIPGAGRAELGGILLLPDGWNLEAAYALYVEPTEDQEVLVLALGRAGVSHRVAEDPAVSVRLGGALRHMQDWIGPAFGADVTLGIDMLLGDSVVLSAEAFAGVVGAAWLLQARASLGFLIDIVELRLGYDHVVLEPLAGGPGGMLTGPFLGARLWL